jgi:hypothetical protein
MLVHLLSVFALVTKEIKHNRFGELDRCRLQTYLVLKNDWLQARICGL